MPEILRLTGGLVLALATLFFDLFASTDKAGGKEFLKNLTDLIYILDAFLKSDVGIKGLNAILVILLILTAAFIDIVIVFVAVLGFIEDIGDGFVWLGDKIWDFLKKIWQGLVDAFTPKPLMALLENFLGPFDNLPSRLYNIGVQMIKSFIAGMLHQKDPAMVVAGQVIAAVAGAFPHSPAKYGAFSGAGSPFNRGVTTMEDFTKGIMTATDQATTNMNTAMSNVNFGPGAIIANFNGALPTPNQAQTLGTAVGGGISDQLLARNAALAVRTM